MMLAIFFMMVGQSPVVAAIKADALDEDIVVIGRKMTEWRGYWKLKGDVVTCKTTKSSKNVIADKLACDAIIVCTTQDVISEFTALKDRKILKADRIRRSSDVHRKVTECAQETALTQITALAEQRAAAAR